MDLQSAVALTTIPGISRPRAAVALKDLREHSRGRPSLEDVIATCCRLDDADVAPAGGLRSRSRRGASGIGRAG